MKKESKKMSDGEILSARIKPAKQIQPMDTDTSVNEWNHDEWQADSIENGNEIENREPDQEAREPTGEMMRVLES